MTLYKLQKGVECTIAQNAKDVKAAQAIGYELLGECDEEYNIIKTDVSLPELPEPKDPPDGEPPAGDEGPAEEGDETGEPDGEPPAARRNRNPK